MCGRFERTTTTRALASQFQIPQPDLFEPLYNIAPTQPVAAVRRQQDSAQRELIFPRWGLVPSWSKKLGSGFINARAETVAAKPAFRSAFKKRRCLLPATGFYEWQKHADGKQPFHIRLKDGALFAFAGLWERWHNPEDGEVVESCTILTTTANDLMKPIHDRMPVILDPADYRNWLEPGEDSEALQSLLKPYGGPMEAHPVSTYVNNPRNQGPKCIEAAS